MAAIRQAVIIKNYLTLTKHLVFFFLAIMFSMTLHGQSKSERLKSINAFVCKIDNDTTILRRPDTRDKGKEVCGCQAIDIYTKNDSLCKVTMWVLHVSILKTEYYYTTNKLIFVRQTKRYDHKLLEKHEYYFSNDQLISVIDKDKPAKKDRNEASQYFLDRGKGILTNIVEQ